MQDTLTHFSIKVRESDLEKYFLVVDEFQQKKDDFKINLLDGVKSFFSHHAGKYTMTIFTSDRKKNAQIALTKLGINKYFSKILP